MGKLADFCILNGDILTVKAHNPKDMGTLMTIVNGEVVYDGGVI